MPLVGRAPGQLNGAPSQQSSMMSSYFEDAFSNNLKQKQNAVKILTNPASGFTLPSSNNRAESLEKSLKDRANST